MRLLLIEDDCALCEALRPALEGAGYRVDACHDGADALQLRGEHSVAGEGTRGCSAQRAAQAATTLLRLGGDDGRLHTGGVRQQT